MTLPQILKDLAQLLGAAYALVGLGLNSAPETPWLSHILVLLTYLSIGCCAFVKPFFFLKMTRGRAGLALVLVLLLLGAGLNLSQMIAIAVALASWLFVQPLNEAGKSAPWKGRILRLLSFIILFIGHLLALAFLQFNSGAKDLSTSLTLLLGGAVFIAFLRRNRDLASGGEAAARELIARELAARLDFGLPLGQALADLRENFELSFGFRALSRSFHLRELSEAVSTGDHAAQAFRRWKAYPSYWVRLLELAPHTDALAPIFRQLAELENRRRPLLGFLPIFNLYFVMLVFALMFQSAFTSLAPQLAKTTTSWLTLVTQALAGAFENGVILYILWWGAVILALFPSMRKRITALLANWVYPESLARRAESCQLMAALEGLTRLGLPLSAALEIASQGLADSRQRESLRKAAYRGGGVAELAAEFPSVFPEHIHFLIRAGEKTDSLPEALKSICLYLDEEFESERRQKEVHLEMLCLSVVGLATLIGSALLFLLYSQILTEAALGVGY